MEETMLTIQEVAETLRVSDSTVRRWVAEGKIEGLKFGRQWRFKSTAISRWLEHGDIVDNSELEEPRKRFSLRGRFKGGEAIPKEAIDKVIREWNTTE
ncbi:helix-turn-helix domain-containing protein [Candidatus Poribacteria bacterium]